MKRVALFGATGSVGRSAADVLAAHPERFTITTLTAARNADKLAEMAIRLGASHAVIADEAYFPALKEALQGTSITAAAGRAALIEAAREPVDLHLAAIVGMAGLEPLIAAIGPAKNLAIANKEPLVAAGELVMGKARAQGSTILPVDSEHNAIFQVFDAANRQAIEKIILTASGGPFRDASPEDMARATPQQALQHPNWSMGAKISIDSATMMNKALEVIEAHYLFDMPPAKIEVLVHPQSIVHSMVEYADGSVLAQLGAADMKTPLTNCLGWPDRLSTPGQRLDWQALSTLSFSPVDHRRFPAIKLAYDVLESGQAACIALNAANEIAVAAFLEGRIGFLEIVEIGQKMVDMTKPQALSTLEDILALDSEIRVKTIHLIHSSRNRNKQQA